MSKNSYSNVGCLLQDSTKGAFGYANENEFFIKREQGNKQLFYRNFDIKRPEVYNIHRPQNTDLEECNRNEHILKYPGMDSRSKEFWNNFLSDNSDGVPVNPYDCVCEMPTENDNTVENNAMTHVSGTNINIDSENSLRRLGMLNNSDVNECINPLIMSQLRHRFEMQNNYFNLHDQFGNDKNMFNNMTKAVNNS